MKIVLSSQYLKAYRKIIKNNPLLHQKTKKQLRLLIINPCHPSLRLHKLTGKQSEQWSISIDKSIRLIFEYVDEGIFLTNIGHHNEVY